MSAATGLNQSTVYSDEKSSDSVKGFNIGSFFDTLKAAQPSLQTPSKQLEYLFEDEYVANGPSWGARICYGTGITYILGLGAGGVWGLFDGLRNPAGATSRRLRINCILNSCTARGPFLANSIGMLALLYNLINGSIIKARGGNQDIYSTVGSGMLAGMVYRSTRGLRAMGQAGALFASLVGMYQIFDKYYLSNPNRH